jgi:putative membrane protein
MRRLVAIAMCLGVAATTTTTTLVWAADAASDSRSSAFIAEAIEGNLFEIKAGELATTKGASDGVRKFGAMLAKDHASAATKSMAAAKTLGVATPKGPSDTQQGVLEAMGRLEGDRFDEQFIKSMIDDHLRDVARYESQAKNGTDAAAKYAAEVLPTLREHLKSVQGLQNERSTR